jgi:outer membrane receptor protein involved in Fe transport
MSELDNYDARVEWRPGNSTDLIAASVFYKTIADPIQYSTRRDTGAGFIDYIYPENYGDAEIKGIEFEARKGLGFIWSQLSPFSVGGNLTLQDSEVKYPKDIRATLIKAEVFDDSRPMDGESEILGNVNLMFEHEEMGLSVGLFYNLKGEAYVSGDTATDDTYVPNIVEKPVGTLDLIIGFKFAKIWRLGVEIKNLLDPEIETIYRTPYRDIPNTKYNIGRIYGMSLGCEW